MSVCFESKKLSFGWQLLNCTVPLHAAGTVSAECFLEHFIRFLCFQGKCVFSRQVCVFRQEPDAEKPYGHF